MCRSAGVRSLLARAPSASATSQRAHAGSWERLLAPRRGLPWSWPIVVQGGCHLYSRGTLLDKERDERDDVSHGPGARSDRPRAFPISESGQGGHEVSPVGIVGITGRRPELSPADGHAMRRRSKQPCVRARAQRSLGATTCRWNSCWGRQRILAARRCSRAFTTRRVGPALKRFALRPDEDPAIMRMLTMRRSVSR